MALERQPYLAELLAKGDGEGAMIAAKAAGEGAGDVGVALRRERLALATALAIGDLAGSFPLVRVMAELSSLADRALDQAIAAAIRQRVPEAQSAGFFALALGKHGACELNYSSDIDPILLFDRETLPRRERDDPGEAAQRYARTIVDLLSTQTEEGYVFRVDLRLRPASEVSPLAISVPAAITHYESSALAWERAAFIRARASSGDVAAGEAFLSGIRPFVWRRSLDFTALEEIRRLTMRIRESNGGPTEPAPGFNLKRGRGGIREVEFFAQTQQLTYGGRHPALRVRGTREALDALAGEGLIPPEDARELGESYDRLRVIEHRLQMVNDQQTHDIPTSHAAIDNVARLDGLVDGAQLLEELHRICATVARKYDRLLGDDGTSAATPPSAPDERFAVRIDHWYDSIRTLRSGEARAAFEAILPTLLEAFAQAPDPDMAMTRWETLLGNLPSAINLFRLFEQRPGLLEQVLRLLTLARPLADELARHPQLLDTLIDATALNLPGEVSELAERMQRTTGDDGYEAQLDQLRRVVSEERFALGLQLVEARHDMLEISAALARIAEAALETGARAACAEFERAHGTIEGSELIVLALGRLGGGALTHASDLDIVYLFTSGMEEESNGQRPLTKSLYFNRLAQRMTAALSVPTAEGALYEVDTRLRPQGNQGPLAVSLDSFLRYQLKDAWTWEHMALCRARPIFGSPAARRQLQEALEQVLSCKRDAAELREDLLKMRGEMAMHKHPAGPLDAKLLRGGLVDCEFIVHFLQLRENCALLPDMLPAITELAGRGLLPPGFAGHYATLARLLIAARLLAPDGQEPSAASCEALARACDAESYLALLRGLDEARHGVAEIWTELFDESLEMDK